MSATDSVAPSLSEIRALRARLGAQVRETPIWEWQGDWVRRALGPGTRPLLKLELLQFTGSFKPRGALACMLDLTDDERARGVTAVSAGNHAMAVGYAARVLGTTAKVVMPQNANPARVAACRALGAEVVLVPDVHTAFEEVRRIEQGEGRCLVHPFEGPRIACGTATLGLEFSEQAGELDAVIVPIGGGGLCAGVACALHYLQPRCQVFGVEPTGADTMHRSFAAGAPQSIERVRTIADSLGAPHAAPYSFALCRRFVHDLVLVDDDALRAAMAILYREMKLCVEPAGAAATAALLGPLRTRLAGLRIGLIICGANLDLDTFAEHVRGGMARLT